MNILLLFFLSFASVTLSASTIINYNLYDLKAMSINIGSGFALTAGTPKTICFSNEEDNVIINPLIDYQYEFLDIENNYEEILASEFAEMQYIGKFIKRTIKKSNKYHHILAYININSYGERLDETKVKLDEKILALVKDGKYSHFMELCGSYFVRSVTRHSTYVALLTYNKETEETDAEYRQKLKNYLRSMAEYNEKDSIIEESKRRFLRIKIDATGLSSEKRKLAATDFPTDITSFRKVMTQVVELMSGKNSGIISRIELVPWIDFAGFRLNMPTKKDFTFSESRHFTSNIEFMSKVSKQLDNLQILYHQAYVCRDSLINDFITEEEAYVLEEFLAIVKDKEQILIPYCETNVRFINHYMPNDTLKYLDRLALKKIISLDVVDGIYNHYLRLIEYVQDCFNDIKEDGIEKRNYRLIRSCNNMRAVMNIRFPERFLIEAYCPLAIVPEDEKKCHAY